MPTVMRLASMKREASFDTRKSLKALSESQVQQQESAGANNAELPGNAAGAQL